MSQKQTNGNSVVRVFLIAALLVVGTVLLSSLLIQPTPAPNPAFVATVPDMSGVYIILLNLSILFVGAVVIILWLSNKQAKTAAIQGKAHNAALDRYFADKREAYLQQIALNDRPAATFQQPPPKPASKSKSIPVSNRKTGNTAYGQVLH